MDIFTLTIYGNILFVAIVFVLLMMKFNRLPVAFKWLAVVFGWSLIADIGGELTYYYNVSPPNLANNVYLLPALAFLSMFFTKSYGRDKFSVEFTIMNIAFLLFAVLNLLFIQRWAINSYTQTVLSIAVMVMSFVFYYKLIKDLPTVQLHKLPLFWVVSGIFFTYSGRLVIYTVSHYLVTYMDDNLGFWWPFHNIISMIANTIVLIGVWLQMKKTNDVQAHP